MKSPARFHVVLHQHPEMSLENAWLVKTLLNLHESLGDFLVSRWMFSMPALLLRFHCSICDWEFVILTTFRQYHLFCVEFFSMVLRCAHLFQLLKDPRPVCLLSRFSPRAMHNRERFLGVLSFQIDGFLTDPSWVLDDIQLMNQLE